MDSSLATTLGISEPAFTYFVMPVLIFMARICEVSVNTIRIIYMLGGRRYTSTIMGFFEALIWLIAIRQIFQHLDDWIGYVAYAGGFAAGIYVGMIIEEKIAYGKVIVRIITTEGVSELIQFLDNRDFHYSKVDAQGPSGYQNLVFTVLQREHLDDLLKRLKEILPLAFYTIESVKAAVESGSLPENHRFKLFNWLRG